MGGDPGRCETGSGNQDLGRSNRQKAGIEIAGEYSPVSNLAEGLEKENPGALAGATGEDQFGKSFKTVAYRKRAEAATTLCLAIKACEPKDAATILEAALSVMAVGAPWPPLLGIMDAAAWWADFATPIELDAYALACVNRMAPPRKAAFLEYVGAR